MFKLVVLSALVAFVAAKPSGLLHGAPLAYSAGHLAVAHASPVVTKTVVSPSAVSSTYRKDVISEPVIAAAPVAVAHAAPVAVAHAAPVAVAHAEPLALAHAAPVAYAAAAPVVTKTVVSPSAVSSTYRKDVISEPVVAAAPVAVAHSAPLAVAHSAPLALAHSAPLAVAHGSPLALAHSAPLAVAHGSPLALAHSAHALGLSAYAAPLAHGW